MKDAAAMIGVFAVCFYTLAIFDANNPWMALIIGAIYNIACLDICFLGARLSRG
jgi:hypothetical protein